MTITGREPAVPLSAPGDDGPTALQRYGLAVLLAVAAFVFWTIGIYRVGLSPFFLYLAAVTIASGVGGRGPGIVVIVFGAVAGSCAYAFPGYFVFQWPRGVLQLALFLFIAITITLLQEERLRTLRRERALRLRSEQLVAERGAMMEQMTEAVLMADPSGRVTYLNDAARRLFAAPDLPLFRAEQMGDWLRVFGPDGTEIPGPQFALARAVQGNEVRNLERVIERPDGSRVDIVASARQVRGTDGQVLGAIATIRDVTAERALQRERRGILSAVVHDLKSPLATIKGVAQLSRRRVLRTPGLPADFSQPLLLGLGDVDAKVSQMVGLINDLVEMDRRPHALDRRRLDLLALIRRLSESIDRSSDDHTVVVETRLTSLEGTWDESRLGRALENLLSNAVKYSPEGGIVRVCVERVSGDGHDEALVTIIDHGIGIPPEDAARIFDQFYRAANAVQVAPGTGIGLAAVKRTVESHGGSIAIESSPGRGTTVSVRLPLETQDVAPSADDAAARSV